MIINIYSVLNEFKKFLRNVSCYLVNALTNETSKKKKLRLCNTFNVSKIRLIPPKD